MPTDSTPGTPLGVPELLCYPLEPKPPAIVPARAARDWMDATDRRYAYRCLPLSIASASGWEVLCPSDVEATWDGGSRKESIRVSGQAVSHFGHGILTFHVGHLFRTSPGWAVWVACSS